MNEYASNPLGPVLSHVNERVPSLFLELNIRASNLMAVKTGPSCDFLTHLYDLS